MEQAVHLDQFKHNNTTSLTSQGSGVPVDTDGALFKLQFVQYGQWLQNHSLLKSRHIPFDIHYSLERIDDTPKAFLILAYSIITVLAIVGNVLILCVLGLSKRPSTERTLTIYFANLAIADILMACFCIPFTFTQTILRRWIYGPVMCPLVLFMQVLSVTCSVFIYIAIAIDRFWAVLYPMKLRMGNVGSRVVLLIIWVAAGVFSTFQIFLARLQEMSTTTPSGVKVHYYVCNEVWSTDRQRMIYSIAMTSITYVIPFFLLTVMYSRICCVLWGDLSVSGVNQRIDDCQISVKRKATKMLIAVIVAFGICWFPLNCINLIMDTAPDFFQTILTGAEKQFAAVFYTCHWLAMSHSTANFVIFLWLKKSFREELTTMMRICCLRATNRNSKLRPTDDLQKTRHVALTVNASSVRTRNPSKRLRKLMSVRSSSGEESAQSPHTPVSRIELFFSATDEDEDAFEDNVSTNLTAVNSKKRTNSGPDFSVPKLKNLLKTNATLTVDLDWQPMQEIGLLNTFAHLSAENVHNEAATNGHSVNETNV